jgi:iron(III) transport system ATP-binding protein
MSAAQIGLSTDAAAKVSHSASVRIEHLNKSFGAVPALKDLSLNAASTEMLVLVGPSGCGKTTCLRCIAGLERPSAGRILIGERTVTAMEDGVFVPPEKRQIGMVFQSYAVWPHMTVFENVAYPLRAMVTPRSTIKPRVEEALRLVQLGHLPERYSSQLSGGQQQRVALARSLVAEPALILFDEPLSNLDANLRTQMRIEIKELQKKLGFTGVYVTHDQEEALAIGDRVAIMDHGLLRQVGTPREVYDHPANSFVAGFMGSTSLLHAQVSNCSGGAVTVEIPGGFSLRIEDTRAFTPGDKVIVSARPECLSLLSASDDSAGDGWPGVITFATFVGDVTIYRVRIGGHLLEVRAPANTSYEPGAAVSVKPDAQRCRLLRD